ncbi:3-deoxy-D-manno-octulosonic acid transferase [Flagellimonas sp. HMM57]|uniref:3-deoxy-D-manno-octulosonic acid transferase n=1 Tax=unclassified Flagellimonas TaxID=2644544 RepID=UPI001F0B6A7A|nr:MULTISPECIES: glycosyltransferase N-terminal domain-containing protein [unclassified Flagellimonas]UII77040.1 3-deoxy-D-manno-octulosonic acid transferase [Flagellimonas sp. HMM57]
MKLFVSGRKEVFQKIETTVSDGDKYIWMHVASLGEYEQGLPILERIKSKYPSHKIALTFFSPSGYEVKKNTKVADIVIYLPMDTLYNAKRFLDSVNPEIALFIKYEIWPNYLFELKKRAIPTLLVSAIFSKRQIFFKAYGGFMRKSLESFSHFFVQNESSKQLLTSLNFENVSVGGDTRFDRVSEILKQDNVLDFMRDFKKNDFCFVAGSTWPEDEEILIDFINSSGKTIKYVIAPHTIKPSHIEKIQANLSKKSICYSSIGQENLSDYEVLIIDTIGLLTKIYSYADVAYVGGAFATGLHNTLEPAVYGIPVIIGPNYSGFREAEDLVDRGGIHVITDNTSFESLMNRFHTDTDFKNTTGNTNTEYIKENLGATELVMEFMHALL